MKYFEAIRIHLEEFKRDIENYSRELLYKELPVLSEEKFLLYEQTGNRLIYEKLYFERRKFLNVFFFVTLWHKEKIYIKKLEEIIYAICKEDTWALPAHVDMSKDDWKYTTDLFAAETAQALSCICHYLGKILSEECTDIIKENVWKRIIKPYVESEYGYHIWENWDNNWISVCASSIGSAVLYLPDDKGVRDKILDRVKLCLDKYIGGFSKDGVCLEGMSYFTYGMEYFFGFARQLYEYTDGEKNLYADKRLENIVLFQQNCFLPGGNTISFSDGSTNDRFRLGLACFLKSKFKGFEIPPIDLAMKFDSDGCYRFMANLQDDLWVSEFLEDKKNEDQAQKDEYKFIFYKEAQWAIWNIGDTGLAIKGGNNNEPHNHNDIGSFILSYTGEIFLTDLGCGEYTKDYFKDDTRYKIFNNRSLSHNVPLINGEEQKAGEEYKCLSFESPKTGQIRMSYASAYGLKNIELDRNVELYSNENIITIEDVLSSDKYTLTENLITSIKPKIENKRILITGKKATLCIDVVNGGNININEVYFSNHKGVEERVWQIQFNCESEHDNCRIELKLGFNKKI
jgi:hypothetical protein